METRGNSGVFGPLFGQDVVIRIGHKDWDDGGKWKELVDDPSKAATLPRGFQRGMLAGIVRVNETLAASEFGDVGRLERASCLARDALPGKFGTILAKPLWLSRGIKSQGHPGAYEVQIPADALPKGFQPEPQPAEPEAAIIPPDVPVTEAPKKAPGLNRKERRAKEAAAVKAADL